MPDNDYDVVVIGSGAAGLSAAITAREAGASVMLLEADTHMGGATRNSTGVFYAAGTDIQRQAGIEDTPEAMYTYLMAFNQFEVRPDVMRYYAEQSPIALAWLQEQGVEFPVSMLIDSCVSGIKRGHTPSMFGLGLADALINKAGAVGVETALGTRVDGLLTENGRVTGIKAQGFELRAGAVIIATGGFGNSPDMLKRFFPKAAYFGSKTWAVHRDAPFILGDGITLGESIGANITGHNHGVIMPSPCFAVRNMEAFLPPWLIAVNQEGRRFMAEWESYCVVGDLINAQTGHKCWAIFDHKALAENDDDTTYTDPYNSGHAISSWEERTILAEAAKGIVKTADSIAELAGKIGIDPLTLEQTVSNYNASVKAGEDRQFHKDGNGRSLPAFETAPYYAVEVFPAIIAFTAAGLETNLDCQVLDIHGCPIPGLYAAGETVGSFHGKRYGGGGMNIGGGVIFGRRAGAGAASLVLGGLGRK